MAKKVIGVVGYKNSDGVSFGVGNNYLEWLSEFGNPVILMPWQIVNDVSIDMLFLPGGLDTSPANYGEVPRFKTTNQDVFKEFFFKERLKGYIEENIPILGMCLGMQMLAVYFGSKLQQNLKYHAQSKDRWETAHDIRINDTIDGDVYYPYKEKKIKVNSHHHQAVTYNLLNKDELAILATAENEENKDNPIIEAFVHKTLPIIGIQHHEEELFSAFGYSCMNWLLKE